MWLWVSRPLPENVVELDYRRSMYLRRFEIEHTYKF